MFLIINALALQSPTKDLDIFNKFYLLDELIFGSQSFELLRHNQEQARGNIGFQYCGASQVSSKVTLTLTGRLKVTMK
jgi:hypothetical protein